eukprot:Sspe_Gene.91813::Locus_63437_Transcript_1_1_Confidence_1.000_Length_476::g.91813::m.91813
MRGWPLFPTCRTLQCSAAPPPQRAPSPESFVRFLSTLHFTPSPLSPPSYCPPHALRSGRPEVPHVPPRCYVGTSSPPLPPLVPLPFPALPLMRLLFCLPSSICGVLCPESLTHGSTMKK